MKAMINKVLFLALFILLIFWSAGMELGFIFDLREIAAVILGTFFLTLAQIKSRSQGYSFLALAKWNVYLTSFVITFTTIAVSLSGFDSLSNRFESTLEWFRPLVYGGILYTILDIDWASKRVLMETWVWDEEKLIDYLSQKQLTQREQEVTLLLMKGSSNKTIAEVLFIAESTVKRHASHIYGKLKVTNRVQLRQDLIEVGLGAYKNNGL